MTITSAFRRIFKQLQSDAFGLYRVVFIVHMIIVIPVCVEIYRQYEVSYDEAISNTTILSHSVASTLSGSFNAIDLALSAVGSEIERQLETGPVSIADIELLCNRLAPHISTDINIRYFNRDGKLLLAPGQYFDPGINIADAGYFKVLKDDPSADVTFVHPMADMVTNQLVLQMVRRVRTADRKFAGVIVASISIDALAALAGTGNLGADGATALYLIDHTLVARYPLGPALGPHLIGTQTLTPKLAAIIDSRLDSKFDTVSVFDQVRRTGFVRRVGAYDMFLVVTTSEHEYLHAWRNHAFLLILVSEGTCGILTMGVILLRRQRRMLTRTNLELTASESRSRAIAEKLRSANRELEQIIHVAAHDLRQPLRAISSHLQVIQLRLGQSALADDLKSYLDYAIEGARRLDRRIIDLLSYSQTVDGAGEFVPVPLCPVIEDSLAVLGVSREDSGVTLKIAADLPTVHARHHELIQLFQNLIGNAIKYRDPARALHIEIDWRREGAEWVVWVKDNGLGIDKAHWDRIFHLFQRLVTREAYEGTGIGLALCKKIVEHFGGRIWVDSTLGLGSAFFVSFPIPIAAT